MNSCFYVLKFNNSALNALNIKHAFWAPELD